MSDIGRPGERVRVDREGLWRAVDRVRAARGATWAQVADEIGTSGSTFTRLRKGYGTDADTFAGILAWLGADAADFVHGTSRPRSDAPVLPQTSALLRSAPRPRSSELEVIDSMVAAAVRSLREARPSTGAVPVNRARRRR